MGRVQAATSGGPSTCTHTRRAAPLLGAHRSQTPARLTSSSPSLCTHAHRPHYPGEAPKAGIPPCLPPVTGDSPPYCWLFLPGRNSPSPAPVNPTPGSSPRPSHTVHQPLQPRARIPLLTALPPSPESPLQVGFGSFPVTGQHPAAHVACPEEPPAVPQGLEEWDQAGCAEAGRLLGVWQPLGALGLRVCAAWPSCLPRPPLISHGTWGGSRGSRHAGRTVPGLGAVPPP